MEYDFKKDELTRIWLSLYTQRKYLDFTGEHNIKSKIAYTRLRNKVEKVMYKKVN